jgi:FAD-linked oxidoreductase
VSGVSRRDFVRATLAAAAAGLLPGCRATELEPSQERLPAFEPGRPLPWRNWGANQGCRPALRTAPGSEQELVARLAGAPGPIRPVGTGHSFSALVPTEGTLVAADGMSGVIRVDAERTRAEVFAGTRLHQLGPALAQHGQAMPNLPDIDYPTLGGAVATSTHGTGEGFGSLSSMVEALVLATPQGELVTCDRDRSGELFQAARCSLGALGVVTRMTLQNQAPVRLTETMRTEDLDELLEDVERRRATHRHFEFFAFPHTRAALSLTTDEAGPDVPDEQSEFAGSLDLLRDLYGVLGAIPAIGDQLYGRVLRLLASDEPLRRTGPSYRVLPHPRIVRFREMEYTVPAEAGPDCLREILRTIRERRIPVVFPIEYRYVKADDAWLSMFHERNGCTISIHQFADRAWAPYFDAVEPIFWRYEGRPHWGKLHSLDAATLSGRYPRWRDFLAVREALDPAGRFLNAHLARLFGLNSDSRS